MPGEPGPNFLDMEDIEKKIRSKWPDSAMGNASLHPKFNTRFNPTSPPGKGISALLGLVVQMNSRWKIEPVKVREWTEITPSHPEFRNITAQRQDAIRQLKESLAHVDRALSDVELLEHDIRKYKEILSYFAKEDSHSLKAMFIDQVDVYLPEGVSLRSIAPRWPTIIADFQELDDEDEDPDKIMKKIEVSKAEAVILATKIRLYNKWKEFFGGNVKGRYRRLMERLKAREKSIEEYRNWARPLIKRIYQMKELDSSELMHHPLFPVGTGFPISHQNLLYWAWTKEEGLQPIAPHKAPREIIESTGEPHFIVEPYDDLVKMFIKDIEKIHGVEVMEDDILKARKMLKEKGSPGMLWYNFIEIPLQLWRLRLPDGAEIEDIDFNRLKVWLITQNVLLIKLIELVVEEKKFDLYIDELLGKRTMIDKKVRDIKDLLAKEFPELYGEKEKIEEKKAPLKDFRGSISNSVYGIQKVLGNIFGLKLGIVKPGHYDPQFMDRIGYDYGREWGNFIWYRTILKFLFGEFGAII